MYSETLLHLLQLTLSQVSYVLSSILFCRELEISTLRLHLQLVRFTSSNVSSMEEPSLNFLRMRLRPCHDKFKRVIHESDSTYAVIIFPLLCFLCPLFSSACNVVFPFFHFYRASETMPLSSSGLQKTSRKDR